MIDALLAGKLQGTCSERTARNGTTTFVVGKLRCAQENGDMLFISLIAFRNSTKAALLALDDGDACSVAGALTIGVWSGADGVAHPQVQCRVDAVQTAYSIEHKRRAVRGDADASRSTSSKPTKPCTSANPSRPRAQTEPASAPLVDDELEPF
jgi:single-stranded DNA-binding protein